MVRRIIDAGFRLRTDSRGASAILFALALPAILGAVGGGVDYASLAQQSSVLRQIADSTALSLGRQMTMSKLSDAQLQSIASAVALANGKDVQGLSVTAQASADGLAVSVKLSATAKSLFGITTKVAGISTIGANATARVGQQTKLCLLSVANSKSNEWPGGVFQTKEPTGIDIQNDARLTAPDCLLHTNINTPTAFMIGTGAKVTANVVCAAGGVVNNAGMIEAAVLDTCPQVQNPMDGRFYPNLGQNCTLQPRKDYIFDTGVHTLRPGNYCGSIILSGDAKVTLMPGNYAIQGEVVTRGNSELRGAGVGLYLWGGKASDLAPSGFSFLENSLIDLSAPETGPMAGMLIWEGINGAAFDQAADTDGSNYHQINTMRAKRLTGTIYLPGGRLLIDAPGAVAEESDYTVLVVNRLDLSDGPNLVLNANYSKSRVPVPFGLGPIGARNVRLEK